MRFIWLIAAVMGPVGCTGLNPAFLAGSAGDSEGASGDAGSSGSTTSSGETTLPVTTGVQPTTGDETTGGPSGTGAVSVGDTTTAGETTGTPPDSTTVVPESTGMVDPASCGNGILEAGEACDDGLEPPQQPDACLPTCDGKVPKKKIFAFGALPGDFTSSGTFAIADDKCKDFALGIGLNGLFKALLSDGVNRIAAKSPLDPTEAKDWVLHPYTAYINLSDQVVWVTGPLPLLGVIPNPNPMLPNVPMPLQSPINNAEVQVWTGMAGDWQSATNNCGQWKQLNALGKAGNALKTTNFLDVAGDIGCQKSAGLICVEQ